MVDLLTVTLTARRCFWSCRMLSLGHIKSAAIHAFLIGLLNPNGFINTMSFLGVIDALLVYMTDFSIYMGMLLTYLPFMILPLGVITQ